MCEQRRKRVDIHSNVTLHFEKGLLFLRVNGSLYQYTTLFICYHNNRKGSLTFRRHRPDNSDADHLLCGAASRVDGGDEVHALILDVGVIDEERGVCQLDEPILVQRLTIPCPCNLWSRCA